MTPALTFTIAKSNKNKNDKLIVLILIIFEIKEK